ncbi:hypothetical protein ACEPAH_8362 [Sanghuangporus vaninii]
MPSVRGNGVGYWTIKSHSGNISALPQANLNRFSEAYEEAPESGRGTRVFLLVMTGFFIVLFVGGMIACRLVVRQRARKHVKKLTEVPSGMSTWRKSVLESLSLLETTTGKESASKAGSGSGSGSGPAIAPDPTPTPASPILASSVANGDSALHSPKPRYGYQQATSVLESVSELALSEDEKMPEIIVSSIEEDIFSDLDISILPRSALTNDDPLSDDSAQSNANTCASAVETSDVADASVFSSFFSVEMLEEMTSIAEDLKRFSFARSIDGEIKSVESRRSSVVVVEQVHQRQPVAYRAECIAACNDSEKMIDALDGILSELRDMINQNGDDDRSVYSQESSSSYFSFSNATVKSTNEDKKEKSCQEPISATIMDVTELNASPRSPLTAEISTDTTLEDEATLVSSPTKKGVQASSPGVDMDVEDAIESPGDMIATSLKVPRTGPWYRPRWSY